MKRTGMVYGTVNGLADATSRLVLGGGWFRPDRMDAVSAVLDAFVEAGGTAVDTAHVYGNGGSERALGKWLRESGRTEDIVIISKGAHPDMSDWLPRVNPEAIGRDLAESLERLGVEKIDLYFLHRDDPMSAVGPVVECLNEHVADGSIRAFGASNWTHQRIEEGNAYAGAHGLRGFAASSPHFALAVARERIPRGVVHVSGDSAALSWYRESQFPLFAWSSQAGGFFSGRFWPDVHDHPHIARQYFCEDNWERLRRVHELAARHGCTPIQVALAWVLHQQVDAFPIFSTSKLAHLEECLGALDVSMTFREAAWLNLETREEE